jgi:hypothetical protein
MGTRDAFEEATARGARRRKAGPVAVAARYDRRRRRIVVSLGGGLELAFPPEAAEGLAGAAPAALETIEVSPSGLGLHWPALDADLYLPALLDGAFGSRRWMAARLGAAGGRARSAAKAEAARENGRRGGRPRKAGNG